MKKESLTQAIDLMIEDLYTKNQTIRNLAKEIGCEEELDYVKEELINYLYKIRQ